MNSLASYFAWHRFRAVIAKEWRLIIRDPAILAMSIGIPLMQVILFSYAIDTNPKHLPTAVINYDDSALTRSYLESVRQTEYFSFVPSTDYETASDQLMKGYVQFVMVIPPKFGVDVTAGKVPSLVLESDSTDPVATNAAMATLQGLHDQYFSSHVPPKAQLVVHSKFNPKGISRYYIVPGLIGVILLFTLCMLTAVSIVKERVMGTMEILLASPIRPLELILGKIIPYVLIGYVQFVVIVSLGVFQLGVPFYGSFWLLAAACMPYILANLIMGVFFSVLGKNEIQAMIATTFFMLPSILLSGFVFPFQGMPVWAQWIGMLLPLTHFNLICKGIMLKGIGVKMVLYHSMPIFCFIIVLTVIALSRFKKTLD